jgi:tRNA(Ile)-lysidine synthase
MFEAIHSFIRQHNLINNNDTIIIGLSGGPDSVYLLHVLKSLQQTYNLKLIAAHLNHEWRAEADAEELFCATLAQQLTIPFFSTKLSLLSQEKNFKHNGSKEQYARNARRYFWQKLAQEHNANSIALGHHAQDQQETFFMRLIRGSSLTGLTGMKPKNGLYIRPLLETNKTDILKWLQERAITYASDASNESHDYLRNRIRMNVLPALNECDARFNASFLTTMYRLRQDEDFLHRLTENTFAAITRIDNNQRMLSVKQFLTTDPALHHRVIIHWLITEQVSFPVTQSFFDEIIRFLQSNRGGVHTMNPTWAIVKKQNYAFIRYF